jgi:rhodanese-related sulfurtransferase
MRIPGSLVLSIALTACASSPAAPAQSAPTPAPAATVAAAPTPGQVDGPTAHKLVQDGATLVDVRTADEYATKHLDGAVNVPVDQVTTHDFGGKDKPLVLYCAKGHRSAQAAEVLRSSGYTHVYLLGAMSAWGQ